MSKFFVNKEQINGEEITIIGQDVNHIINVLRMNEGDRINITDLNSKTNYISTIIEKNNKSIKCKIESKEGSISESRVKITVFQGIPKFDKMELIIQKNVELGVCDITPVEMKRTVVKIDEKTRKSKIERWQKISEVAAKQSGRDIIPKINDIINIKNICNLISKYDIVLLAYEEEKENTLKKELKNLYSKTDEEIKIGIIIGPEGGLDTEEVTMLKENGAKTITLGNRILRTETAGIVLTSLIMYELDS